MLAVSSSVSNSCLEKNPFLASMKVARPLSVSIFDQPQILSTHHCGKEWSTHGTCCNINDLEDFIKIESMLMHINLEFLGKTVAAIAKVTETQAEFKNFSHDSKECWSYMKKVRGSALCAICSGRSQEFFSGKKILVSPKTCEQTLPRCYNFFEAISKISSLLPGLIAGRFKKLVLHSKLEPLKILFHDLEHYKPPRALMQAFEEYRVKQKNNTEAILDSIKVCSMVMNIRKRPYILDFNKEEQKLLSYKTLLRMYEKASTKIQELKETVTEFPAELTRKIRKSIDRGRWRLAEKRQIRTIELEQEKTWDALVKLNHDYGYHLPDTHFQASAAVVDTKLSKRGNPIVRQRTSNNKKRCLNLNEKSTRFLDSQVPDSPSKAQPQFSEPFTSDSSVLIPQDSMFTSFDGIPGSTLAYDNANLRSLNTSICFP